MASGLDYMLTRSQRTLSQWSQMRIGRIFNLVDQGCFPQNPLIWVQATWYAVPQALLRLGGMDCLDLAYDKGKNVFRPPRRRGGGRHGRGGLPRFTSYGMLQGQGPIPRGFGYYAFKFGDLTQKIGYQLLFVDVALEGIANWMSAAMRIEGCNVPPAAYNSGVETHFVLGEGSPPITGDFATSVTPDGINFGIGGFATTRALSEISVFGTWNAKPFGTTKYCPPINVEWVIVRGGQSVGTGYSGVAQTDDGHQWYAFKHHKADIPGNYSGTMIITMPGGPGSCGCENAGSPVQVWGEMGYSVVANIIKDPCLPGG